MSRNRNDLNCECGYPLNTEPTDLLTDAEYAAVSPSKARYGDNKGYGWAQHDRNNEVRFKRVRCELCGSTYALWFEFVNIVQPHWLAIDSSYFVAFNDEPGAEDGPTRDVSVLGLAREYVKEKGQAP